MVDIKELEGIMVNLARKRAESKKAGIGDVALGAIEGASNFMAGQETQRKQKIAEDAAKKQAGMEREELDIDRGTLDEKMRHNMAMEEISKGKASLSTAIERWMPQVFSEARKSVDARMRALGAKWDPISNMFMPDLSSRYSQEEISQMFLDMQNEEILRLLNAMGRATPPSLRQKPKPKVAPVNKVGSKSKDYTDATIRIKGATDKSSLDKIINALRKSEMGKKEKDALIIYANSRKTKV